MSRAQGDSKEKLRREKKWEIKVTELKRGSKQRGKRWPEENCPLRREFWIQMWHVRLVAATGGRLIKPPRFPGLSTYVTFYCNCSNAPFTISMPPSDCLLTSAPLKVHIAPPPGVGTAHFENHYFRLRDSSSLAYSNKKSKKTKQKKPN